MSIKFELVSLPTTNITLRSPDLGDSESHDIKTRYRRAMEGTIYGYKFTPADNILLMRWQELNVTDRTDLRAFLMAVIAQEVDIELLYLALADPVADIQTWRGKFISNPFEFETRARKEGPCIEVSTITLQFRGNLV